jgi:micrococcal nuclease
VPIRSPVPAWAILLGLLLTAGACTPEGPLPARDGGRATVLAVIDGDTIVVDIGGAHETLRLLGIDTPETVAPDRPVECFGPEASRRTRAVLPEGTAVRLERDVEARDRYDRLLAYVHREADDLFVNEHLVARGFASVLSIAPNRAYASRLATA